MSRKLWRAQVLAISVFSNFEKGSLLLQTLGLVAARLEFARCRKA